MSRARESSRASGAPDAPKVLGGKLPRIDGPLKVSGRAVYTSDVSLPGMLYAVPVRSTIARGRIVSIDAGAARKLPGVRAVYYRGNIKPFFRSAPAQGFSGLIDEKRPPFEDDVVRYYGQYVAVAVAQTMEQAKAAADAVRVRYASDAHNVDPHLVAEKPLETESQRGDADAAFQSAPVKIDQTYVTPTEVHNPIELHATVAAWDGDRVTLY
jgi:xanthine dehydrogenase YagR molybdenum-binding subunit